MYDYISARDDEVFLTLSFSNDPDSSTSPSSSTPLASTATPIPPSQSKTAVGAIAGGTIASVILLLIVSAILFIYCRRRRRTSRPNASGIVGLDNMPTATLPGPPSQFVIPPSTQQLGGRASYPDFAVPLLSSGTLSSQQLLQVNDSVIESRVEGLKRDVTELREMLESRGDEAPPQYHDP